MMLRSGISLAMVVAIVTCISMTAQDPPGRSAGLLADQNPSQGVALATIIVAMSGGVFWFLRKTQSDQSLLLAHNVLTWFPAGACIGAAVSLGLESELRQLKVVCMVTMGGITGMGFYSWRLVQKNRKPE